MNISKFNPVVVLRRMQRRRWLHSLENRGFFDPEARSDAEAVFIGGCWRSGTSLLRELLCRHPRFACAPESHVFVPPFRPERIAVQWSLGEARVRAMIEDSTTLIDFGTALFSEMAAAAGKSRWIDKTPENIRVVDRLLEWFPKGRFLHVIRDGRDAVCSMRHYPKEVFVGGKLRPAPPIDRPIGSCARTWVKETSEGLRHRNHPRLMELRYEDLVIEPERELRKTCAFLGEDYDPGMLKEWVSRDDTDNPFIMARFINNPGAGGLPTPTSVGRWRRDLTPEELEEVLDVAGGLLRRLEYLES